MAAIVRTTDEKLKKALGLYFEERTKGRGQYVFSDLDSVPALGVPGEITCSYREGATLRRPFSPDELDACLDAADGCKRLLFIGEEIYLDGEKLALTQSEEKILRLLDGATKPLDCKALEELLGREAHSNRVAVHVASLRAKTEKNGRPRLIQTRRMKGYYIDHG